MGARSNSRAPAPAMPWQTCAQLSDTDTEALIAYLLAQGPVDAVRLGPVKDAEAAPAPFYRVTVPGSWGA